LLIYIIAASSSSFEIKSIPSNIPDNLRTQLASLTGAIFGIGAVEIALLIFLVICGVLLVFNYKYSGLVTVLSIIIVVLDTVGQLFMNEYLATMDKAHVTYSYTVGDWIYILLAIFYVFLLLIALNAITYYIGEQSKNKNLGSENK